MLEENSYKKGEAKVGRNKRQKDRTKDSWKEAIEVQERQLIERQKKRILKLKMKGTLLTKWFYKEQLHE